MPNDHERRIASLTSALEQANNTLRGKMDELSLVRRVADAISHHTSIWSLSSELVDAIAETINCKYSFIYAGADSPAFELQAVSSIFSGPEQFPVSVGQTRMVRYLEQSGGPIQISNIEEKPIWCEDWPFVKTLSSWLCVPMLTRNHLVSAFQPYVADQRISHRFVCITSYNAHGYALQNQTCSEHLPVSVVR